MFKYVQINIAFFIILQANTMFASAVDNEIAKTIKVTHDYQNQQLETYEIGKAEAGLFAGLAVSLGVGPMRVAAICFDYVSGSCLEAALMGIPGYVGTVVAVMVLGIYSCSKAQDIKDTNKERLKHRKLNELLLAAMAAESRGNSSDFYQQEGKPIVDMLTTFWETQNSSHKMSPKIASTMIREAIKAGYFADPKMLSLAGDLKNIGVWMNCSVDALMPALFAKFDEGLDAFYQLTDEDRAFLVKKIQESDETRAMLNECAN